ncbi:ATP-utilizing enzyme of the PP-loop superfamily [hydrothermal vent metagenome]|uniref:ATP-utilizing enzyme of the PP-loop superfamily n=1 Tax=hydrothermal vent metagenome TaxID=652676 RepID=A0A3B1CLL7_9ZZZZ
MNVVDEKLARLQKLILNKKSVIVAFSGGVDSSFLLKVCHDTLKKAGGKTVAVTGNSASYPASELADAKRLAQEIGAEHMIIDTDELKNESYSKNPPDRCYHCKTELFKKLASIAKIRGITAIFDGTNADDLADHRPGSRARDEKGVISPLQEARLTKDEIRTLSKKMGLFTWNKPAFACLASRMPYGSSITTENLKMVETAEDAIRKLGFAQVRVRHHGEVARIEFLKADIPQAMDPTVADSIYNVVKKAGFLYVSVDIKGYRQGSMNETKS